MSKILKIAVMSDMHITSDEKASSNKLRTFDTSALPTKNHLSGLKALIEREQITADILLCPGDISDKADPAALTFGWNELETIQKKLQASTLVATAGNHDMDSRFTRDFDAKGMLQSLRPFFPGLGEEQADRYWSRNFAVIDGDFWRIVTINTSAYHGYGKEGQKEADHGRISDRTLERFRSELSLLPSKSLNILLCHHHLYRDNTIADADYSEMQGADKLLSLLDTGDFGDWLVIHGHKHHPRLTYAAGGGGSCVIFSAGSLSAELFATLAARVRNQFYLIELPVDDFTACGLDLAGQIRAWDWVPMYGWKKATSTSGLPHRSGFGARIPINSFASQIAEIVSKRSAGYVTWGELLLDVPNLQYLLPGDLEKLNRRLNVSHSMAWMSDDHGLPLQIGPV